MNSFLTVKFDKCGKNKHDAVSRKLSNAPEKVRGMLYKAEFMKLKWLFRFCIIKLSVACVKHIVKHRAQLPENNALPVYLVDPQFEKVSSVTMARNVSDMYYTLNGSYFNRSDDEHDHHSASYKLYRFLPKLSFYWAIAGSLFFLVVSCLLYTYFSSKGTSPEETAETVKKTHRDRKFGTFVSWFYFASNSMILWMDIVAVVYCYGGFVRNCPPISDEDFSYAFFLGALCPYVVILICVCDVAKDIVGRENISNADLHDALVNLIHREEPVVMWTAKENDDDPYPVATEVRFLCFRCKKIRLCIKYSFQ